MSKIVILNTQLGAPQVISGLLDKIAAQNPALADWIKQLDTVPIIRECIENTLTRMSQIAGIRKEKSITDYYGKAYAGELAGSLKTDRLPNGLGLKVNAQGTIEFVADDYTSEWRSEIERLRKLFTDAFLAETTSSILQILGYEVQVHTTHKDGNVYHSVEGVRQ